MTLWDLITATVRRWPILLAGAVLTAVIAYVAVSDDGVYYTRTELVLLAPSSTDYPNTLKTKSGSLVVTAGLLAKRMMGPGEPAKYASPDVTLIGEGIREGWSLRLPDTGGQWASNFGEQVLFLEIVAPDRETVEQQQETLIRRAQTELDTMQREFGVEPINDITVRPAPQTAAISHVAGSRPRVLGMSAVIGVTCTLAVIVLLEYRQRRRDLPYPARLAGDAV
jgi:hypothetical protein